MWLLRLLWLLWLLLTPRAIGRFAVSTRAAMPPASAVPAWPTISTRATVHLPAPEAQGLKEQAEEQDEEEDSEDDSEEAEAPSKATVMPAMPA